MSVLMLLALGAGPPTPSAILKAVAAAEAESRALWAKGGQAAAAARLEKALALAGAGDGRPCVGRARVLGWLAEMDQARDRWKEAVARLDEQRRELAALRGPADEETLRAGWAGDYARRWASFTPAQHAEAARAHKLNDEAVDLIRRGELARALPPLAEAVDLRRGLFGERSGPYLASLGNLGQLHSLRGDYRAALPLLRRAAVLSRETRGELHPSHVPILANLAAALSGTGDHAGALPLARKALALREQMGRTDDLAFAQSLNNLAAVHLAMKNAREAIPLFERSLELRKKLGGTRQPSYALALSNLSECCSRVGDSARAIRLQEEALDLRKKTVGERHPDYAQSVHNLALLRGRAGDPKAARDLLEKALALREATLGPRHPLTGTTLVCLAQVLAELRDEDGARKAAGRALDLAEDHLHNMAAVQSEREQLAAVAHLRDALDVRLELPDADCYVRVLSWKGAVLLRQQHRREFARLAADPATRAAAAKLEEATRRVAVLAASPAGRAAALAAATAEQERLQAELARLASGFEPRRRTTPKQLADALPEDAALIDYLVPRRPRGDDVGWHLVAFVSRRGKPVARVELGPLEPAIAAIRAWRFALNRRQAGGREGAAVKKVLWAPLEKHLEGARTFLVSPDGPLAAVPWAALPGGKSAYLLEEAAVAVVPVPSQVPGLVAGRAASERRLLCVGGVDYGKAGWAELPATAPEADAVEALFGKGATALRGDKAGKGAVREALGRHRFAHLATHGLFLLKGEPLLRSGVVLSGGEVLTALEVAEMDLSGLELATLSACETGLGKVAGSEGLLGLQRAFAVAGCRSVVSSLWSVDDAATSVLMERFYHHLWKGKKGKAEALRAAQLDVLRDPGLVEDRMDRLAGLPGVRGAGKLAEKLPKGATRRSPPAWWAGFVASGDWR